MHVLACHFGYSNSPQLYVHDSMLQAMCIHKSTFNLNFHTFLCLEVASHFNINVIAYYKLKPVTH